MTDKEVGQAWKALEYSYNPLAIKLIRKLIEERAKISLVTEDTLHYDHEWESMPEKIGNVRTAAKDKFRKIALRDFGIDPEEWKEKP